MNFKISVVTVTFNCEDVIEDTILSVINQSYLNKEYIVIDGKSKDSTLTILNKFSNNIDILVSEPDNGIYDAMNKAITLATGDYIIFMNAGDVFYDDFVIEKVFTSNKLTDEEIIYGTVILEKKGREIELKPGTFNEFWKGSRFCHQSAFISLKLHKQFLYNLNYKIAADYNFFYAMYNMRRKFLFLNLPFSKIFLGGVSDLGRINLIKENIMIANDKRLRVYFYYFKEAFKAIILSRGRILTYYIFNK